MRVTNTESIQLTPKDGKWYAMPNDQYIRWNFDERIWDYMITKEGDTKPRFWDQLPDGTVSL